MGKQASVAAAVAGSGAGAGAGAAAGAAGCSGGVAAAVVPGESLLEEPLEPQPVIAKMNKNPSGAKTRSALNRYAITTCSKFVVIHTEHERLSHELTKTVLDAVSATPLSVTHRPEALRHRLAPGMPLNESK